MNIELLKAKMDDFFATTTPEELIKEFEKRGYKFVDAQPSGKDQDAAREYAESVNPYKWPLNKEGEEITWAVGQKAAPFSAKHKKENKKLESAFLAGISYADSRRWVPVTERLPENEILENGERPLMVIINTTQFGIVRDVSFDHKAFTKVTGKLFERYGTYFDYTEFVTHWMPEFVVPAPPQNTQP